MTNLADHRKSVPVSLKADDGGVLPQVRTTNVELAAVLADVLVELKINNAYMRIITEDQIELADLEE